MQSLYWWVGFYKKNCTVNLSFEDGTFTAPRKLEKVPRELS